MSQSNSARTAGAGRRAAKGQVRTQIPRTTEPAGIDRINRRPAYRQVADELRKDILAGTLPAGSLLPSETELIARFDVSRVTARSAVKLLQAEGLIITRHGRGSYVRSNDEPAKTSLRHVELLGCDLAGTRCVAAGHVHELVQTRMPTLDEQDHLQLPPGVPVLVISRDSDEDGAVGSVLAGHNTVLRYVVGLRGAEAASPDVGHERGGEAELAPER